MQRHLVTVGGNNIASGQAQKQYQEESMATVSEADLVQTDQIPSASNNAMVTPIPTMNRFLITIARTISDACCRLACVAFTLVNGQIHIPKSVPLIPLIPLIKLKTFNISS